MGRGTHRLSSIDLNAKTAECAVCGPVEILHTHKNHPTSHGHQCANSVKIQNTWHKYDRKRKRLTWDEVNQMLEEQGGLCAICGNPLEVPCVDHDHETNQVRGLLCNPCNRGLGLFKDKPETLRSAAAYIEKSKG